MNSGYGIPLVSSDENFSLGSLVPELGLEVTWEPRMHRLTTVSLHPSHKDLHDWGLGLKFLTLGFPWDLGLPRTGGSES